MRTRNAIEAEISKLEAELADVKEHETARDSAVYILKNLGWTRQKGKWVQPAPKRPDLSFKQWNSGSMTHIKVGDFCTSTSNADLWYVRKVEGRDVWCSRVTRIDPMGTVAGIQYHKMNPSNLRVTNPKLHMGYRKSAI